MQVIRAIIPVAGMSRRMGDFKPLLKLNGKTVIENCVERVLSGTVQSAVVVTGYRGEEIERVLLGTFGGRVDFARNTDYEHTDMMHSIKTGLSVLPKCDAFFLVPGDMPVIVSKTFQQLIAEKEKTHKQILIPTIDGVFVHPPLIDAGIIPEILAFEEAGGLREFWNRKKSQILCVPVTDSGAKIDVDTPKDFARCLSEYGKRNGD